MLLKQVALFLWISIFTAFSIQAAEPAIKYSADAIEQIAKLTNPTPDGLAQVRRQSELSINEVLTDLPRLAKPSTRGRQSRPANPPDQALYVDIYQESPVLINYDGSGNKIAKMSFGVVYKYLTDPATGKIAPHYVRAQVVSTGREGFRTPVGEFDIDSRHRYYVSQTYGSEMDYAQFFIGGVALHQTPDAEYPLLGGPASHGCVRHHELDAEALWNLIGAALDENALVNVKVYPFGDPVLLADGTNATDYTGFGAEVTDWLSNDLACTRRGEANLCTSAWNKW